jgi:hypothetical protein
MSAKASLFKETDLKRVIRGAEGAGLNIGRVEIGKDGKIAIIPTAKAPATDPAADDWSRPRRGKSSA